MKLYEIPDFLNKKVRRKCWDKGKYCYYQNIWVGDAHHRDFWECDDWEVFFEESKKITLFRYTYKRKEGWYTQSEWRSEHPTEIRCHDAEIVKTETKEVEL